MWLVLCATAILVLSQIFVSINSHKVVREEAIWGATQALDNAVIRLEDILCDVALEADHTEWLIYRHLDSPDTIMEYSRTTVQGNLFLNGCSISMEPNYLKNKDFFSAYSYRVGSDVKTIQEGNEQYQYFYKDWYLMPKLLNQPCWTEPYSDWDEDDEEDMLSYALVSYCKPLTDYDGSFIGSLSLDISLEWLSNTISSIKPYPKSYSILISRGGAFLVHPDPEELFYKTIFTDELAGNYTGMAELGREMIDWKEGMKEVTIDGKRNYVFFKPVKSTGWSMAIVCPEEVIFSNYVKLRTLSIISLILCLLLMLFTCMKIVRKLTWPLKQLSAQAEKIASGNFDSVLPDLNRTDELGTLSRSFSHMQSSLVSYIDELTRSTENRVRIEDELMIARKIQMAMVPRSFPAFPDRDSIDLYATMIPAKEVGGDLYDYFIFNDKLYFCIGDVSGKGIPASLIMVVICNLFRVLGQQELTPGQIARQINDTFSAENDSLLFVTMFIGVIDLETGSLSYCNCGHNPPVLMKSEGPEFLNCDNNIAVGVAPGHHFNEMTIASFKGVPIFLYTDGLTEAENIDHEQFGIERMMDVLARNGYTSAEEVIHLMRSESKKFVEDADASDDLTMLLLKVG